MGWSLGLSLLEPVMWWLKRLALIGLVLAGAYFYARWQGEIAAHQITRTAAATAALQSATYAATTTAQLQKDKDHALQQAAQRAQRHRLDAGSARTELDRLRRTLAAPGPIGASANTCAPALDRADPARELLGQCASALTDLAATADRLHSDRLTLLQAWPRPAPVD